MDHSGALATERLGISRSESGRRAGGPWDPGVLQGTVTPALGRSSGVNGSRIRGRRPAPTAP